MIEDGWCLRNRIVWHNADAMPESVKYRLANRYEDLFLLTRSSRYWFDLDPIREPVNPANLRRGQTWSERRGHGAPKRHGRAGVFGDSDFAAAEAGKNPATCGRSRPRGFPEAHFAVMPQALAERCILAGCKPGCSTALASSS